MQKIRRGLQEAKTIYKETTISIYLIVEHKKHFYPPTVRRVWRITQFTCSIYMGAQTAWSPTQASRPLIPPSPNLLWAQLLQAIWSLTLRASVTKTSRKFWSNILRLDVNSIIRPRWASWVGLRQRLLASRLRDHPNATRTTCPSWVDTPQTTQWLPPYTKIKCTTTTSSLQIT